MAVKIYAFSADLFVVQLPLGFTDIKIKLVSSHKGSTQSQDKTGDKDPNTCDIVGNQKITPQDAQNNRHHKRKTELPDEGEITEYPQSSVDFSVIRKTYLRQTKPLFLLYPKGNF